MKHKSKKKNNKVKQKVIAVSGGFDPLHIGHVRLIKEAKRMADKLVVILNNDNWLRKKKGSEFMRERDRKEILEAIEGVDEVIITRHPKNPKYMSVHKELLFLRPDIFANGGDRNEKDASDPKSSQYKDAEICRKLGIKIVFNVGNGGKIRSSSELLKAYSKKIKK